MRRSRFTTQEARKYAVWSYPPLPTDPDTLEQLRVGMEVETEHADVAKEDPQIYAMIAASHLREDPLYYLPLVALERFRDGEPQGSKIQVSVSGTAEGYTVVVHLLGHDEPLWGHTFTDGAEAKGVASLLKGEPALGIVYAWMILTRHR